MADNPKLLNKTIEIDGTSYDVTATVADKVVHPLVITKATLGTGEPSKRTSDTCTYDGHEKIELNLVTAGGGKFTGPIRVESAKESEPHDEAVLNYKDIRDKVISKLENTVSIAIWNGSKLTYTDETDSFNGIRIISGTEDNLLNEETGFSKINYTNKLLAAYLYICSDTNNIYFGTSDNEKAIRLVDSTINAASASEAVKLANGRKIMVDLGSEEAVIFDGTKDIDGKRNNVTNEIENPGPGITGILPVKHGGTGTTSLSSITVGTAGTLRDASDGRIAATAKDVRENITRVSNIISGETYVAKASNADNAVKLNGQSADYYQKKATISTSIPTASQGSVGDIWIVYKD